MRKLPTIKRSSDLARISRPGWLALYAQGRRRRREATHHASGPTADLMDSLVAHFGFEESSGDRFDDVGATYFLEEVGGAIGSASGLVGNAVGPNWIAYLLGTQQTSLYSPTGSGFTVSFWANFGASGDPYTTAHLASVWDDNLWPDGSSWEIWVGAPADGDVHVQLMGTGTGLLNGTTNLMQWTHICLVYDGDTVEWTLWLNGAAAMTINFDHATAPGKLSVGGHANFSGSARSCGFDELAIWSRGLNPAEVDELYNNGLGLAYPY